MSFHHVQKGEEQGVALPYVIGQVPIIFADELPPENPECSTSQSDPDSANPGR